MVNNMSTILKSRDQEFNLVNSFRHILHQSAISVLSNATTQHLVRAGKEPIKDNDEYCEYIGTRILRSCYRLST